MLRASSLLKNTRLDKEYELIDIAKKLKIPVKYLAAIENEDIKNFPNEPYCSLFIKDYGDYLNLNGGEILSRFRRDFDQKKKTKSNLRNNFSFTPQFTFKIFVILVVLLLIIYLIFEYIKFNQPPKLKIDWPETVSSNNFEITGVTDPDSTIKINGDLIIINTDGTFSKTIPIDSQDEIKISVESESPSGKITIEEKTLEID